MGMRMEMGSVKGKKGYGSPTMSPPTGDLLQITVSWTPPTFPAGDSLASQNLYQIVSGTPVLIQNGISAATTSFQFYNGVAQNSGTPIVTPTSQTFAVAGVSVGGHVGPMAIVTGTLTYDAVVSAYQTAITTASGTISASALSSVNLFYASLVSNSLYSGLNVIWRCAGDQLAAAMICLKHPSGLNAFVNHNFVSGDYVASLGLTGNGSSKYLDTAFSLFSGLASGTSGHVAAYWQGNSKDGITQISSNPQSLFGIATYHGSNFYVWASSSWNASGGGGSAIVGPYPALVNYNSDAVDGTNLYSNATVVVNAGAGRNYGAAGSPPPFSANVTFFQWNGVQYTSEPLSFGSIGPGYTPTQIATYEALVGTFMSSLGRTNTPNLNQAVSGIVLTGQSNANGQGGYPVVSAGRGGRSLMYGKSPYWFYTGGTWSSTTIYNLVEGDQNGTQYGETPLTGFSANLESLIPGFTAALAAVCPAMLQLYGPVPLARPLYPVAETG